MRTREELEEREDALLAPWGVRSGDSEGRAHPEPEHAYRTAFQRDRDRIVHCGAFRRLEYKTQVFVNSRGDALGDSFRTRLTHTLEVAQIARTVARALGLNEELTETLALVHDLGHPPFGHAGEDALARCMADHGGFEHNRQGLRIVTVLERRYPAFRGLNLTYETREGIAKHGDFRAKRTAADFRPEVGPPLEALVADRADRLAYNHHDLDDGLSAGLLTEADVRTLPWIDEAFAAVDEVAPGLPFRVRVDQVFIRLINESVTDLVTETSRRIADAGIDSVEAARAFDTGPAGNPDGPVGFSPAIGERQRLLHEFLYARFYSHWEVARMQENAKRFLTTVFDALVDRPRVLPPTVRTAADDHGLHRAVCDHVAGMTDRELHREYRELTQP